MSTKATGPGHACDGAREPGRGWWYALAALAVMGSAACGETYTSEPLTPGSIVLAVETSGFLQDDSYELLVDGASQGMVAANDEVTIAELDPATYVVDLGDVADNCVTEGASVAVSPGEAASISLTVTCGYMDPDAYTLRFTRDRPDLDTGENTDCLFGLCPGGATEWDIYVHYNSQTTPKSVIRQNQTTNVEIAHLPGVVFEELTEEDVAGAVFTTSLVADPFDDGRVILIRTNLGNVYVLGNPVEDTMTQTLTFDAALIAEP